MVHVSARLCDVVSHALLHLFMVIIMCFLVIPYGRFSNRLLDFMEHLRVAWLVILMLFGKSHEKKGGDTRLYDTDKELYFSMRSAELNDLKYSGKFFTWHDRREDSIRCKQDRAEIYMK